MTSYVFMIVMSSVFLNPSFGFSSHFDSGGGALSELSWPSSLAVVTVSFSGLFTFIFLMLACLCCKKGDIRFKEFENNEGEEYQGNRSTLASPGTHNGPDVYVLPLTEVSLPVAKQPCRSIQLLKSADLGRNSLLYLKELGYGWFGKVLLGEVNAGLSTTQVVVKELKASASVQGQVQFLEEVQPYRTLQHPALLQCLAQCTDVTPYLLIMEYCPLGDVKGYLRGCRAEGSTIPDPLTLQRMACQIASGLQYLHKHNYTHSDLALRNCVLTSDMALKIGDYGLAHSRYKDDYLVTTDQIWVPLRWIAPELIDEVHGNLLVVDQTKASNVWSLGVTIWELFELGNQPYRHYTDRQVLTYAVKEQQLKLPKPLLNVALSERWYEVMQFCWLQPEQRPVIEEVCMLLNYLCAKSTSEGEEDFEERWNSLRPCLDTNSSQRTPPPQVPTSTSSFPLLEHFSMADSFQSGDEILTVTETSHGLNFEYNWEQARTEQPYCSSSTTGPPGSSNANYQDTYYPLSSTTGTRMGEGLTLGVSPSYYNSDYPGVVPVLSAHSPSVSSEYYIRIEEPVECKISVEEGTFDYSPGLESINSNFSMKSPTDVQTDTYSSGAKHSKSSITDSDGSPAIPFTVESSQIRDINNISGEQYHQNCSPNKGDVLHCEQTASEKLEVHLKRGQPSESCLRPGNLHQTGIQISPQGMSAALSNDSLGQCDPYLEANHRAVENNMSREAYHDIMDSPQKNIPRPHNISVDVEVGNCVLMAAADQEDGGLFNESETITWSSNHSTNNNTLNFDDRQMRGVDGTYLDFNHTALSSQIQDSTSNPPHTYNLQSYMEATGNNSTSFSNAKSDCESYIQLCIESRENKEPSAKIHPSQKNAPHLHSRENMIHVPVPALTQNNQFSLLTETALNKKGLLSERTSPAQDIKVQTDDLTGPYGKIIQNPKALLEFQSQCTHTVGKWVEPGCSSINLVNNDSCNDISTVAFPDSPFDYAINGDINLANMPLHREIRRQDPGDFTEFASSSLCEAFSPDAYHTPIQPKSLDSGYDTENNESPEFVMKDMEVLPVLSTSVESECEMVLHMDFEDDAATSNSTLSERGQYRDSAYFSDYDVENDKSPCEAGGSFFNNTLEDDFFGNKSVTDIPLRMAEKEGGTLSLSQREDEYHCVRMTENVHNIVLSDKQLCHERTNMGFDPTSSAVTAPVITMLSPFPPEMGGCLTKESAPDDGLGLDSEQSGEEPASEFCSSMTSEAASTTQEATTMEDQPNSIAMGFSSTDSTGSASTIVEFCEEIREDVEAKDCESGEGNPECQMDGMDKESNGEKEKEVLNETLSTIKRESSLDSFLPALPDDLDLPAPLGKGEEQDEEDSDDSDESDEELRSYSVQEQSEESDEEVTPIPVVVSERGSAKNLRSLLKMPSLLTQSFCDELEQKKKAVSFFDDVTVILFDQDSPTGEMAESNLPPGIETNGQAAEEEDPQPQKNVSASDNPSNVLEESGTLARENDFLLMPSPSPLQPASERVSTPPNSPVKSSEEKPEPHCSRFSVSRFSITHVSDSDMDSMGGNCSDADQE